MSKGDDQVWIAQHLGSSAGAQGMSKIDEIMGAIGRHGDDCIRDADAASASFEGLRDMIAAALADAERKGAEAMREAAAKLARKAPLHYGSGESAEEELAQAIEDLPLPTGERQAVLLTDEQIAWARLGPLIDKHQIGISTPRNMVHRNGGPNAGWGDSGFWGGTAWEHGLARRPAVFGKSSALEVVTELATALAANNLEARCG